MIRAFAVAAAVLASMAVVLPVIAAPVVPVEAAEASPSDASLSIAFTLGESYQSPMCTRSS